jgi:hypothetical protein
MDSETLEQADETVNNDAVGCAGQYVLPVPVIVQTNSITYAEYRFFAERARAQERRFAEGTSTRSSCFRLLLPMGLIRGSHRNSPRTLPMFLGRQTVKEIIISTTLLKLHNIEGQTSIVWRKKTHNGH